MRQDRTDIALRHANDGLRPGLGQCGIVGRRGPRCHRGGEDIGERAAHDRRRLCRERATLCPEGGHQIGHCSAFPARTVDGGRHPGRRVGGIEPLLARNAKRQHAPRFTGFGLPVLLNERSRGVEHRERPWRDDAALTVLFGSATPGELQVDEQDLVPRPHHLGPTVGEQLCARRDLRGVGVAQW